MEYPYHETSWSVNCAPQTSGNGCATPRLVSLPDTKSSSGVFYTRYFTDTLLHFLFARKKSSKKCRKKNHSRSQQKSYRPVTACILPKIFYRYKVAVGVVCWVTFACRNRYWTASDLYLGSEQVYNGGGIFTWHLIPLKKSCQSSGIAPKTSLSVPVTLHLASLPGQS